MPLTLPNTTLNLSTVDQLKAVYEYVVAELSLAEAPNPFTNGLLRQSDQGITKAVHDVISANLVSAGCNSLPPFSISDYGNDMLIPALINGLNLNIAACNLGGGSSGLRLIPTGATETADGDYQRFVGDTTDPLGYPAYYADLAPASWQTGAIEVQFKWPDFTVAYEALTIWFSGGDYQATVNGFGQGVIHNTYFQCFSSAGGEGILLGGLLGAQKDGELSVSTDNFGFSPAAGDIATLTFTRFALTLLVGGNTATLPHIAGMFAEVPLINVLARVDSATLPLSIKARPLGEQ